MAVAPLQLPGYATPQSLDFSSLANLGQVYKKSSDDARRQATLAQLGQGENIDPRVLLASGDMSLANLGVQIQNRQQDQERQARQDQRQTSRDAVDDNFRNQSLSLQRAAAARANEGPEAKAAQRTRLLQSQGIDPTTPEGRAYVISGEWSGAGAGGASLNPVYGVGPNGEPAMVQTTKTGQAIQTKLPDGFKISKDPIKVDLGTHIQLLDPQTRQPIGVMKKDVAGVEQAKIEGDARGTANVALPQVEASSQQILKTIDDIEKHPGKQYSLGAYSKLPTVPGTSQANFRAAAGQLKGQTFLQAYQTLKGGGAITDVEGAKGENALARLDQAQTTEAYDAALNDFKTVIKAGIERARAKAKGVGAAASPDSTAADPLGIR